MASLRTRRSARTPAAPCRSLPLPAVRPDLSRACARVSVSLLDVLGDEGRRSHLRTRRARAAAAATGIDADGNLLAAGDFSGATGAQLVGSASGVIRRADRFLDDRVGAAPLLKKALRYVFPDHWTFMLGEIALYSFVVLVGDGHLPHALLRAEPRSDRLRGRVRTFAWARGHEGVRVHARPLVRDKAGLLIRQTHHWAANRLRRRDRRAPAADLLHGSVQAAARREL